MQEPYELQEAHDLANDKKADKLPCCAKCGGIIWEDKAVCYNSQWICWECEEDIWKDIREDYLERTAS